jgi:hypothetical protein
MDRLSNRQSAIGNRYCMNIQKMMAQAQAMQQRMQEELSAMKVEATAGGGMVKIEMSGSKEILAVHIEKAVVDPEDVETLQDLILAASREATRRVDEAVQKKTAAMFGGMMR